MTALSLFLAFLTLSPAIAHADSGASCTGECQESYTQYLTLYCGEPVSSDACDKRFSQQYAGLLTRWGQVCADTCEKAPSGVFRDQCEDERQRKCAVYAQVSKTRPATNLYSADEWALAGARGGFGPFLAEQKQDLADYKCGRAAAEALYNNFAQERWTSKGLQRELERETDLKSDGAKCEKEAELPAAKGFLPSFGHKERGLLPTGDLIQVYLGDAARDHLTQKIAFIKRLEKGGEASDADKAKFFGAAAIQSIDSSSRLKKDLKKAQKDSEAAARQLESGRRSLALDDDGPSAGANSGIAAPFWRTKAEAEQSGASAAPAVSPADRQKLVAGLTTTQQSVDLSLKGLSDQETKLKALQQDDKVKAALGDVTTAEAALTKVRQDISAALNNPSQAALDKANGDYANIHAEKGLSEALALTKVTAIDASVSDAAMQALGQLAQYQGSLAGKDPKSHLFDPRTAALDQDYVKLKGQPLQGAEAQERDAVAAELTRRVQTNCGKPALPWKLLGDFIADHPELKKCVYVPGGGHSRGPAVAGGSRSQATGNKIKKASGPEAPPNMKADVSYAAGDQTISQYQKNQLGDGSELTVTWAPSDRPQDAYKHYLSVVSGPYSSDGSNYILQPGAVIEYKSASDEQPHFYTATSTVYIPKTAPDDVDMADRGGLKPADASAAKKSLGGSVQVSLGDRMQRVNPKDGAVSEVDWQDGSLLKVEPSDNRGVTAAIKAQGKQYEIQGPAKLTMRAGKGAPVQTIIGDKEEKCVELKGDHFDVKDSCDDSRGGRHWWDIFSITQPPPF